VERKRVGMRTIYAEYIGDKTTGGNKILNIEINYRNSP
jgi:hypothetical protein